MVGLGSALCRLPLFPALLLLVTCSASAAIVFVDQNAPGPEHDGLSWDTAFLMIHEGVNAATPSGEVWVADGTYVENVVMGEGVQLYGGFLGAEPGGYETELDQRDCANNVATIDGNQSGSCVTMAVDARVDGFTITNGSGTDLGGNWICGGGFYCDGLGETGGIANNTITANSVPYGVGGGVCCNGSSLTISNNTFADNTGSLGGGLECQFGSAPVVTGNTFTGNQADFGGAIDCEWESSPAIAHNTITGNSAFYTGGGICSIEAWVTAIDNVVSGNRSELGGGILVMFSGATLTDNEITGNQASDCGGGICFWNYFWEGTVARNTVTQNSAIMGGGVHCFDSSPPLNENTIVQNSADIGGGICCRLSSPALTENTIIENSARLGAGLHCLEAASPSLTGNTIGGNAAAEDGGGIYSGAGCLPTVTGNTITDNSAGRSGGGVYCNESCPTLVDNDLSCNRAESGSGGGIHCYSSSPTVTDNTISGNSADGAGGGMYSDLLSSPLVRRNEIRANSSGKGGGIAVSCGPVAPCIEENLVAQNTAVSGGGIECEYSSSAAVISGNTIAYNSASWGGGICCWVSSPAISRNLVLSNVATCGGGIYCWADCYPAVGANIIMNNSASASGGGADFSGGSPFVFCNIVTNNHADGSGGGVSSFSYGRTTLTNNTIARNTCGGSGGGIAFSEPHVISNNVVWGNSCAWYGGGIRCSNGSDAFLFHNDVCSNSPDDYHGCEPGQGDISADPLFVDPDGGNWHLSFGSPCIDAGTNDAPYLPEADWEGEARVYDGDGDEEEYGVYATVDMGADEFVPFVATAPDPQPECDGPLFGLSEAGFPSWVWFSIPIDPDSCCNGDDCYNPATLLGFPVSGHLWRWDEYDKFTDVYQKGFSEWDVAVGEGYLLFLWTDVPNPSYLGISPFTPWSFEHKLGRQGWTWIGMPGLTELSGQDFMSSVKVKYPSDETGEYRTAQADYESIPENWIAWGWPYWNTWLKGMEVFTPYAPFGHRTCYPWLGYRVWVNTGTAMDEDDRDQVTLIWPKGQ